MSLRTKLVWVLASIAIVVAAFVLHGVAFFVFALLLLVLWVGTALALAFRRRRSPSSAERETQK